MLGAELATVADWIEPLKAAETDPALRAFAGRLEEAVKAGYAAEDEVKAADKALSDFRLLGERKKAVDALNAARAALLGKLLQFQHDNSDLRLGAGWAGRFFRKSSKGTRFGATIAQVEQAIQRLDAERAEAGAALAELQERAKEIEAAKASRAKAREDLAALRKTQKEQKAQEKALKAEANKKIKK